MESISIPSNPPGVNAVSYRIMPTQGRIITLSRSQNDQVSKQSIEGESKENTLPNLQAGTVFRFGDPLHRIAALPPAQTPPRSHIAPARTPKPTPLQERPRPTPSPAQHEKRELLPVPGKSLPPITEPVPRHLYKSGKWVPDEDNELRAAISAIGTDSWEKVAIAVGTRSSQQCRDRWTLYLADGLNSNDLTPAEVELMKKLLPAYVRNRKKPWAKLAESFPSRTGTILKNAWKRYENSQKPKRALSQSSIIRAQKREEAERLAAEEDDADEDDLDVGESLYEYLTSSQLSSSSSSSREPLKIRFKVKEVEAVLAASSPVPALSSPTKPLALRSLPVSQTTPGKVSLLPDYQTMANLSSLGSEFSSPTRASASTFLGGSFFSPVRGLNAPGATGSGRSNLMFSPPRPINRGPGAAGFNLPPIAMTPTPLRSQNPNVRSAFSPLPWRGFDTSLYGEYDAPSTRNVDPSATNNIFLSYADSSIMLPDMHTANASISEFNDPATSAWLFTDAQVPGHNPWSV